jgi:hypothetical protein
LEGWLLMNFEVGSSYMESNSVEVVMEERSMKWSDGFRQHHDLPDGRRYSASFSRLSARASSSIVSMPRSFNAFYSRVIVSFCAHPPFDG